MKLYKINGLFFQSIVRPISHAAHIFSIVRKIEHQPQTLSNSYYDQFTVYHKIRPLVSYIIFLSHLDFDENELRQILR